MSDYVAVLDVGHGNAAVCHAGGATAVIDTGAGSALLEFLAEREIDAVALVLVSHADQDHIGGLIGLLSSQTVKVDTVYLNANAVKDTKVWEDLTFLLGQKDEAGETKLEVALTAGQRFHVGSGSVALEVLAPSKYLVMKGAGSKDHKGRRLVSNSVSAVVRIVAQDPIVLLPGDLDVTGLMNMLESGIDMTAHSLVFPHHGGKPGGDVGGFVDQLLAAVKPNAVLFSIGHRTHSNPDPAIIARIVASQQAVKISCTQMSRHCAPAPLSVTPEYVARYFARGRNQNLCCAGTMVIPLQKDGRMHPEPEEHSAFVREVAPTALCQQTVNKN